ncbi:MAG: hypothetical protein KGZ58_10685 [Ignavibacteriales bacterium]|nr:hypothetical protein [Ignavibacteriales bacterium]
MNLLDYSELVDLEEKLSKEMSIKKIKDLPDFPFKTLFELRLLKKKKAILLESDFHSDVLEIFGLKIERIIYNSLGICLFILMSILIVLSIYISEHYCPVKKSNKINWFVELPISLTDSFLSSS